MSKHTPGPYRLFGTEIDPLIQDRYNGETIRYMRSNDGSWIIGTCPDADGEYKPIAQVTFQGKAKRGQAWNAPDPEGFANARLIAAAPDLAEATQLFLAWGESGTRSFPDAALLLRACDKARAALAKASL